MLALKYSTPSSPPTHNLHTITHPSTPSTPTHNDTFVEYHRFLLHGNAFIPAMDMPTNLEGDLNIGAAGQWLSEEIKATNGHTRYVPGLVAHIGRFQHPLMGAQRLFKWWKGEMVPVGTD